MRNFFGKKALAGLRPARKEQGEDVIIDWIIPELGKVCSAVSQNLSGSLKYFPDCL